MRLSSLFSLRRWVSFFLRSEIGYHLSDKRFIQLEYFATMGRWLNLRSPVTFNEKLQWLKLYDRNPMYTQMVDKACAKEYAARIIGQQHIIPTYGIWDKPEDIDFDSLPEQFVLKVTHDSGGLVICRKKSELDRQRVIERIKNSLQRDYYMVHREWPYKNVKRRILAEAYMEDGQSDQGLTDYKFFCFNGIPRFLYVSQGLEDHSTAKISFFDFEGKQMPFSRSDYRPFSGSIALPQQFSTMIRIAQELAQETECPFVRVDLYSIQNTVYFSEITFYPCTGMIPFTPAEWDAILGEWLRIPHQKRAENLA